MGQLSYESLSSIDETSWQVIGTVTCWLPNVGKARWEVTSLEESSVPIKPPITLLIIYGVPNLCARFARQEVLYPFSV